jgi:hypothetical protein
MSVISWPFTLTRRVASSMLYVERDGGLVRVPVVLTIWLQDSDEAKAQDAIEKQKAEAAAELRKQLIQEAKQDGTLIVTEPLLIQSFDVGPGEEFDPKTYVTKNQFNFGQRAAQTFNPPIKVCNSAGQRSLSLY